MLAPCVLSGDDLKLDPLGDLQILLEELDLLLVSELLFALFEPLKVLYINRLCDVASYVENGLEDKVALNACRAIKLDGLIVVTLLIKLHLYLTAGLEQGLETLDVLRSL